MDLGLVLSILLFLCSCAVFLSAIFLVPTDRQCDFHTYPWSPAVDSIQYHWETFENVQFAVKTPYFGFVPTDKIEQAWIDLLPQHPISIPSSRLKDLGQSLAVDDPAWVRDPRNPDSVLALPEYAVQLGCLNLMRQTAYRLDRDYSNLAAFKGNESLVWERTYQCAERLRQAFMCWSDVTPVGRYYTTPMEDPMKTNRGLVFDFGTFQRCRDFERIQEWTQQNGIKHVAMDNLWWGGSGSVPFVKSGPL
ncbi:hypothetical protein B0H67DRAFT_604467 [Lasiosphaeris hirsuta]|uniref:Uncharacterized protein n=1 Tax=Lasiosphaeris hirsuta TaxID=260670 RepID=A0AA40DIN6_9PEZI|nr:hypothetical protein B0H67DRAFT_604467 [Lasiosphaeris hirsuta]